MLRSILVALDDSAPSHIAQDFAIALTKRLRIEITGLAILDRAFITAPTAVGIGGLAYKRHRDEVKLGQARQFLTRIEHQFEADCGTLDQWQVIEAEGAPLLVLEEESGRHDVLIMGRDTDFHLDANPTIAQVVHRLLRDNPCPLIVCPDTASHLEGPILAAVDGTVGASRCLHMLALLGHELGHAVHVLSVDSDLQIAQRRARYATDLLTKHEFDVSEHGIQSTRGPSEVLLEEARKIGASMIAAGARRHNPVREFFIGSTLEHMLENAECPMFVTH